VRNPIVTDPLLFFGVYKKGKCLDQAYAAGKRVAALPQNQLDFAITGNQEVVTLKDGAPLFTFDEESFERIKDFDVKMCATIVLPLAFPPRLVVVRSPSGAWEVAY
jgi:hypothetical protein